MYRFLLTPRWVGWFFLVVAAATACLFLGNWQLDRRNQTVDQITKIETNYDRAPVPFSQASRYFSHYSDAQQWLPVTMVGTYDTANERVVRNRPLNGSPGYEVVVPLRLTTGETVIIDRGWLPIGNRVPGHPDVVPAPATGEVTVVARIQPGEPTLDRGAPAGQLASIDLPTYAAQLGYPVLTAAYGQLASETPAAAQNPTPLPKPSTDEGPHLSYLLQWYAFGVLFFVGYGYAARQQARLELSGDDWEDWNEEEGRYQENPQPRARPAARTRRRPSAEEEEDALLDAQGF